jgi:hypothetical protein
VLPTLPPPTQSITPVVPRTGLGLNPGFMNPEAFYNTFDPAQSRYNWGASGYQVGPTFDARAYNQAYGDETPWGLQQIAQPLTGAQIADIAAGRPYVAGPVAAKATRREAYNPASMVTPNAQNVYQLPVINAPVAPGTVAPPTTTMSPATQAQQTEIVRQLGPDWMTRQQQAAASGDWATYNQIQQVVNSIINPYVEQP